MAKKLSDYDPAGALTSDDAIEVFLADAFETGDARRIAKALGVVARAKGMTKIARATRIAREQLDRSLSEYGNPTLETMLAVMTAIGFEMTAKRRVVGKAEARRLRQFLRRQKETAPVVETMRRSARY